jgi:hypothetical protein
MRGSAVLPPTNEEVEDLSAKVAAAFADVPRPSPGGLVPCDCDECAGVAESFAGLDWREVGAEMLEENYDKLPLLSAAAFRHFLPAYLLYSLEHFEFEGVCEYTLYHLTPDRETETSAPYYAERFAAFTPEQMDAVYGFLELARRDERFANQHTSIKRAARRLEKYSGHAPRAAGG